MSSLCSWSTKLNTWRYLKPVKMLRFTSTGTNFTDSMESDFSEKIGANEVRLLGRVGMDALLVTKEGKTYARFSLATKTYWKDDGDEQEKTDWHTVMVFEPNLVMAVGKYVKKGQRLYLSGKLNYATDGNYKKSSYILLQNFINISS